MLADSNRFKKLIKVWLYIGLFMVFFQVIIGGVTRLTGSGLSITKWEIITGTLPPLSHDQWHAEFDLYKQTPQYAKINKDMSLKQFKFIYFWEYLHRLWARVMGFVFIIPFSFLLLRKLLRRQLVKRLFTLFFLAAVVASFGWIMVASGLVERPWVNAYKLSLHLSLACVLFVYLLWIILCESNVAQHRISNAKFRKWTRLLFTLICVQIFFGGIMSGMKAGLFYPSWPDMNGTLIPAIVFEKSSWSLENFNYYDRNGFMPALIQVLHRFTAYAIAVLGLVMLPKIWKQIKAQSVKNATISLGVILMIQITIGIITLLNCVGTVPVFWGVLHQGVGIILLASSFILLFQFKRS